MKPSRNSPRRPSPAASKPQKAAPAAVPAKAAKPPFDLRLGTFFLWLLILVPPFVFYPIAKESFRYPKLLLSEWLALASATALAWGLSRVERVRLADLWRSPAVRAVVPMLAVATAGLAFTSHPLHAREGLIDLWIGAVCLAVWSLALPVLRLERLLAGLLVPGTILAAIGILQITGAWQPLAFVGIEAGSRLAMTSTAGNPGDLGACLVLPCLLAQWLLARDLKRGGGPRLAVVAALAVSASALVLTQTLAALAAFAAGSLLLWGLVLPGRRALLAGAGLAAAAVVLVLAVAPLRERVVAKSRQALAGDWNAVLTNRLDGWRTALWMLRENPLTGVGHGAYRPEFVPAKLALLAQGAEFSPDLQQDVVFANAHNEFLEVGAEWGIPGLLALAWGIWVLVSAVRHRRVEGGEDRALAWAGTAGLAVLSLAHFPFRLGLVAFPALLFLSWVLRPSPGREEAES